MHRLASQRSLSYLVVLVALLGLALPATADAQCGNLLFRIWNQQGDAYIPYGQEIVLQQGQKVHLYVTHRSRSQNPYGTATYLGYPQDFGYRDIPNRQVSSVLNVRAQNQQDADNGRIEVTAIAPGQTALAYSIYGVSRQGVFQNLPQQCRTGVVWFRVQGQPARQQQPRGAVADGIYETAWGNLTLTSHGQRVVGSYPGGTVQGTFDGSVIRGTWQGGGNSGPFEFHLRPNGTGFDGYWAYAGAQNWEGRWDGRRIR